MNELTELEIANFAHNFTNLINSKKYEITQLTSENRRLTAMLKQFSEPSEILTADEIKDGQRPVYCYRLSPYNKKEAKGFWAVPLKDGSGVICSTKGVLSYFYYNITWHACSAPRGEEAE